MYVSSRFKPRKLNIYYWLKPLAAVSLGLLMCIAEYGTASAATGPFTCSSDFYQVISGQLKTLDPLTGNYTNVGNAQADAYNAIGYDALDNYIYGIKTNVVDGVGAVGDLVRISNDGTLTDLGAVSGLPTSGYNNGSTDLAGNLYVRGGNNTIYQVNLATKSATALNISGSTIVAAADSVIVANKIYFLSGSSLSIVDLGTDSATTVTVSGPTDWLTAGNSFGAGWSDQAGELFFSNNASGSIYQITNFTTATPDAVFKVAGTVTSNNDGANCPLATQSVFDPPVATNANYSAAPSTASRIISGSLLTNDVGNDLTVTSNTNPAHGTVQVSPDGSFTYTPNNGFNGTDSFSYVVTDSFGRTTSATVTLSIPARQVAAASELAPDAGFGIAKIPTVLEIIAISTICLGLLLLRRSFMFLEV